nr:helix-turn-helix transcriptional regulator [Nitrospinaceae bacterium]NIR54017.1 helix-turn-helix transcriptional regulator [Nitrospinaceae bacterium]NIS84437.1 helix-turn-helix transcriptional regulator [Nitrospinaceae bacterium]NIT81230.1 helix-turn-helix transcriptional regulator [Nitrospinaceae bacterium]NIU43517.1 helix-turn-helix transcriptional regulator [Nitrospinaceae bacterium]
KTIRKNLGCTQMALSEVLDVGFRTYVRYEAGERDAPVSLLVKLAKLGNISLDRLLTTRLTEADLLVPDVSKPPRSQQKMQVLQGSLEEGRLMFKGIKDDFLVTTNKNEKKLLKQFRKLDRMTREKCLMDLDWMLNNKKLAAGAPGRKKVSRKTQKAKNAARLKKMAKSIRKTTLKG